MAVKKHASPPTRPKVAKLAGRLGRSAFGCVLRVMRNDRAGLAHESAAFLDALDKVWKERGVTDDAVWTELAERIALAERLRARGIRPRKGGQYRSTKLP